MNLDFQSHIPEDFADESRVWIYQSSRLFFMSEALEMEDMLNEFVARWDSHGHPVKGYANLFFGQFIVIMADETATGVSGCSTDSSVRLIKAIEEKYKVQLFDRQTLAFLIKDKTQLLPLNQLDYAVQNGFITPDTLYFNNTVLTKKEWMDKWLIPVKESWLAKRLALA
ncbi:MAG TPA: hypothetical protein DCQ97_03915 [Chitinophagaceae bacterium]|nr:hypothetical protein [Chitinophagaceae bacterium]